MWKKIFEPIEQHLMLAAILAVLVMAIVMAWGFLSFPGKEIIDVPVTLTPTLTPASGPASPTPRPPTITATATATSTAEPSRVPTRQASPTATQGATPSILPIGGGDHPQP